MTLLGPDGQPVEPTTQDTPPPPQGTVTDVDPALWGMGFVARPDGTYIMVKFDAAAGDVKVTSEPGLPAPTLLIRCRPTDQGHVSTPELEPVLRFMESEVAAVAALRRAEEQVVAEAEAATRQEDPEP